MFRLFRFFQVAGEGVLELVEAVALEHAIGDPHLPWPDLERTEHPGQPASVNALTATTGTPGRLLDPVQVREQVGGGARLVRAEGVPDVGEQEDQLVLLVPLIATGPELLNRRLRLAVPARTGQLGDGQQDAPDLMGATVKPRSAGTWSASVSAFACAHSSQR